MDANFRISVKQQTYVLEERKNAFYKGKYIMIWTEVCRSADRREIAKEYSFRRFMRNSKSTVKAISNY